MSCLNFSITDELLDQVKNVSIGVFEQVVNSKRSMSLATRCNANIYFIFLIATHAMSCIKFIVTDKLLTKLWLKIYVQWYLSKGSP